MGSHINAEGKFQSDKYPTCPAGKVPLSVEDPTAQDLLWEYAQRRREVDSDFAEDLERALVAAGYKGDVLQEVWLRCWMMGEAQLAREMCRLACDLREPVRPRIMCASFMRWLAGEEVAGEGPWARRHRDADHDRRFRQAGLILGHVTCVRGSVASLHGMLRHVGYTEAEADALVQAFRLMFPHAPERVEGDDPALPTAEQLEGALVAAGFTPRS